jgi:hypothetical protein
MNEDLIARINAAMAVLHAGMMTCQEAADLFGVDRASLWRRCARAGFSPRKQRAVRLRRLAAKAIFRRWKLPRAMQPAIQEKKLRIVSQRNPNKRAILAKLRKGTITIPKAAKLADAPISGVIGWMKLANIPIPAPYNASRRKKGELYT